MQGESEGRMNEEHHPLNSEETLEVVRHRKLCSKIALSF